VCDRQRGERARADRDGARGRRSEARRRDRQPTPAGAQTYVARLEPAFCVNGFRCKARCDGDGYNAAELRSETRLDALRRALSLRDIANRVRSRRWLLRRRRRRRGAAIRRRSTLDCRRPPVPMW